ncbi:hypothetical protein COMA2_130053 [Candidatus Nitrospira nitrificans]|uniref:Uncharacterized protein n=1 Tax=Candidatus Nitrospira nitrificans TaxID=1742973 RepID=A0A0S4L6S6_9BACT|nr:hypothetical protein COMA2_130053 [Candidatus Nitrospira nitrificans]
MAPCSPHWMSVKGCVILLEDQKPVKAFEAGARRLRDHIRVIVHEPMISLAYAIGG